MQKRHYYSTPNFRVFYASLSSGLKTKIEKTDDAIKKLKTDVNNINTKYLNSSADGDNGVAKKLQKLAALIATLEELNQKQRETLAVIIRSQEPEQPTQADDYEGLV